MKLVVGLGNVGRKYEHTRHNLGFAVLSLLVKRHGPGNLRFGFQGEVTEVMIGSEKALLLAPHTLMNLSGNSVRPALAFYKLPISDLLVICDDLNLPLGKLRLRDKGSSGGQNGLNHIIQQLGTDVFARLRIGIGRPPSGWDAADYVLARFRPDEQDEAAIAVQYAADVVESWIAGGLAAAKNKHNV